MPLEMKKIIRLKGDYTDEQKEMLLDYIDQFRTCVSDDNPQANVLNGKNNQYTDDKIISMLNRALKDLNSGVPRCNYTLFNFPEDDLLVEGAIVFSLIAEGLLQLRNQVTFSDSGLTINMFDKTSGYQSWAGMMLQQYVGDKVQFKSTVLPLSMDSGFVGVGSEFGYYSNGYSR